MTFQDVVTQAFDVLAIRGAGNPLSPADGDLGLDTLNRILDGWNADSRNVYSVQFLPFTLTPNLQPHTIGIAANLPTFSVTGNRPQAIIGANLILTNVSPSVNTRLNIVDDQWWLNQPVQGLDSDIPTELFYRPDWPNGSIYLWPVPTTAYDVQLELSTVLLQVALTDTLSLPPGYWDAIVLTLAEELQGPCLLPPSGDLARRAGKARARCFGNNLRVPTLNSRDAGMPSQETSHSSSFNYRTRSYNS